MAEKDLRVLLEQVEEISSNVAHMDCVCVEPSVALYLKKDSSDRYGVDRSNFILGNMMLPQELLLKYKDKLGKLHYIDNGSSDYCLLVHYNERMEVINAAAMWSDVYKYAGLELKNIEAGCCGMAGNYGVHKKNVKDSRKLYDFSYKAAVENNDTIVLSTGFSCRERALRFSAVHVAHPLVVFNESVIKGREI